MFDAKTVPEGPGVHTVLVQGAHPGLSDSDAFASHASSDARGTYIADAMEC